MSPRVSKGMLLDGAQMSLSSFLAGTMGFLKAHDIPIEDWVSYMGEQFEDSWGGLEGEGADKIMQHLLALQIRPLGAEVVSSSLTPEKAEVTMDPLPSRGVLEKFGTTPRELLRGFGVTQSEYASVYGMFEPAAQAIGLKWTHRLTRGKQVLRLEATPAPQPKTARRRAKRA